jgi:hypothetical protein
MRLRFHKQRGAVTLIGALFIIITLALMLAVLQRMAASDILDTAGQTGSVEALFLADSAGTCDVSLTAGSPFTFGSGSFSIEDTGSNFNTDFSGTALPAGECRVRVTGNVAALGAQRVIEAIFSKGGGNLLANANANFDEPAGGCTPFSCTPTGWTFALSFPGSFFNPPWDNTGGTGGSRAAQVRRTNNGNERTTAGGAFALPAFTVTAPTTLTLDFDYKVQSSGNTSQEARFSFNLSDGTTTYPAIPPSVPLGATSDFESNSVTFDITGTGPVTITDVSFELTVKAGQPKTAWLDNLVLQGNGGGSGVTLRQWREVVSN